ncbi:ubiquitin carboxyl-terminal hydrolase MINDY-1-like [Salvia splendens]|uniref:ubiquitin carboxyl-terminal hydrolase MINDY-1-like n=1 Tax=Salvia splendens TaxID=180675 RepID=UPI001C25D3F4|nr:ubiquitin carboxyl-terminal hydrolase MINDY-1-like [Salvia splendens]
MDSSPQSGSPSAAPPLELEAKREKEMVHKTKVIQFLGRTAPIILQNDNGPCPLLAICNVLSLKNSLNLSPDIPEVSQEKLLSLVAERLIDSNTNTDNKDTGYVENQLQNIADAIDLLPRLTTGIDVNLKFRRIDDFEFTPECAIYDLLYIPLYHGWIVDPQDHETADAIGAKSYNTLMGELVSLEAKSITSEQKKNSEDDTVDFVAATTAALGIPSPSLSRGQSFNDSPPQARKGDIEEEEELLRALRLSEMENSIPMADGVVSDGHMHESPSINKCELLASPEMVETNFAVEPAKTVALISDDSNALGKLHVDPGSEVVSHEALSSETDEKQLCAQPPDEESRNVVDNVIGSDKIQPVSLGQDRLPASNDSKHELIIDNHAQDQVTSTSNPEAEKNSCDVSDGKDSPSLLNSADSDSSSSQIHQNDKTEAKSSSVDDSEPIYEGEDRILDSGTDAYANREPMYEGEVVLAEQVDTGFVENGDFGSKDTISVKEGEIIKNFMKNSASQLTVYGLFCLQDQVKERELCVFFRNNHFNTMFKYEGELYILATDQGYLNQPDLVWEKLNEVNGDTVYMTGNFKQFKMDENSSSTWDEQNARATTADYLASIDSSEPNTSFNSDLQLAIALQQQEFDQPQQEQQREQQQQRNAQQQAVSGSSRLIVGPPQPQAPRNSGKHTGSSKQESKSKEKCIIM